MLGLLREVRSWNAFANFSLSHFPRFIFIDYATSPLLDVSSRPKPDTCFVHKPSRGDGEGSTPLPSTANQATRLFPPHELPVTKVPACQCREVTCRSKARRDA